MEPTTPQGFLVLADISGYTSYLAGVELDHAHGVLTDLLETIIRRFKPLLTISKLEGDAVFAYLPDARLQRGETLFELIESTYLAFRDRREAVRRNTTCTCNACRAIPALDLKFLLHHGAYMEQSIAGIHELVGSDVNLIHRLLKNHVGEATGWKAYLLVTQPALDRLGLPCDRPLLHVATETYEHLGEVDTFSLDLHARYEALREARREVITADQAHFQQTFDIPAPPAVVWDWAHDPQRRSQWVLHSSWSAAERPGGRTGVGAKNHCAHGKNELTRETVLAWQPFDYYTAEQVPNERVAVTFTVRLEPLDGGTRTRMTVTGRGRAAGTPPRLEKWVFLLMYRLTGHSQEWGRLARLAGEAYARPTQAVLAPEAADMERTS